MQLDIIRSEIDHVLGALVVGCLSRDTRTPAPTWAARQAGRNKINIINNNGTIINNDKQTTTALSPHPQVAISRAGAFAPLAELLQDETLSLSLYIYVYIHIYMYIYIYIYVYLYIYIYVFVYKHIHAHIHT